MSARPQHAGSPGSILHAGVTGRSGIVSFSESERDHYARVAGDVILIDERNRAIGVAGKQLVHRTGLLHRAFSVFLMDARGNILLQRRSPAKYHSAGLWANSCCGHPMPGERTLAAARRRTFEELGVRANLSFGFYARYLSPLANGMVENELVYVYSGRVCGVLDPDPDEMDGLRYVSISDADALIRERPDEFTCWIRHYFSSHLASLRQMGFASGSERR